MTTDSPNSSADCGEIEFVSSRFFSASRELVFEAFSNPDHLVHWWGPDGFTNAFQQFDFRPGGAWRFVMHGPDGTEYPQVKDFVEVVRPERIVFQHTQPMHNFRMTMTFEEHSKGSSLTWLMQFEASPDNEKLKAFIPAANEQNFDRLSAYLNKVSP